MENKVLPVPSSRFKFNLNDYIWFKPIRGRAEKFIAERAERIAEQLGGTKDKRKQLVESYIETLNRDENGWCHWQAWYFMQVFGESMWMGNIPVVEMEVEFEHKKKH